jgi:hypothetical protein
MTHATTALRLAAAVVLTFAIACSPGGTSSDPGADPGTAVAPDGAASEPALDSAVATPEVTIEGQCEPLPLSDESGQYLIAQLEAVNTGNVGVTARVVATWREPRGRSVAKTQRVRLDIDERRPVTLRLDISEPEARAVRRAVADDRVCSHRVRVTGAFGAPRD